VTGGGTQEGLFRSAAGGPLRILVLNWQDRENPRAGGAEIHLHEVFGRMAGWGYPVTLVSSGWPGAPGEALLDGIRVLRTGGRLSYAAQAPRFVRRRGLLVEADVVVEDLNKVPLFTPLWAGIPQVLLVHHLFGGVAFQEASFPVAAATWLLERPIPRVFHRVPTVAVSESTAADLTRRGMPRERITVIPNGIDSQYYRPDGDGVLFPEPSILYLGRLQRYKRVDLILRAAALLRDEGVLFRLLVGGKGRERDRLEALSRRLKLGDRVEFLGFVSEERKLELLQRSWAHVLTSPKEGWGITNLEAAACGTPSVASDSPGLRDSVKDGVTGLLVPHGDVSALARALRRLLEEPALRDRLGREARRFALGFTWEGAARDILSVLGRAGAPTGDYY